MDGSFSRLDEMNDLRPLGHGVQVDAAARKGGTEGADVTDPEMAVPSRRIGVKTDVVVETSERLEYNDRLF